MPLNINFAAKQRRLIPRPSALGYALLLTGSLALVSVGVDFWQQSEENARLQAERIASRLEARRTQGGGFLTLELQNRIEQANKTYALLRSPWEEIFKALESAYPVQEIGKADQSQGLNDIVLLSVKADAARLELALSGQAKNFNALNAFTKALKENGKFAQVTLANHKLSEGTAPVVVNFDLRLVWSSASSAGK